ncbi:DNA polymerase III subunit [Adhaeretor mobilis]|uniref:DNA polymerase III subunit tau n=1 Tax=Adhaeretor mobilis TaxID=1930276 RepID=A0A517MU13_9BACT|nr:DNA polymerase III subunit [Adhaeretor mobilis]QDS98352.1 DNA polymerase III subunit tau [Adhaeretor mobilis]
MWQGVRGHDRIAERFRQSLACGRLASTYLFVGPDGIGKRTFAEALSAVLLCANPDEVALSPCGQCESCKMFAAGNHPDVDRVARPPGKRTLPIDLFLGDREHRNKEGMCHNIAMRPLLGRRRVAIIEDADWFSPESANCLLKTLEEPPRGAVIFLIGTSRSRQLPTILSRSQIVRFNPLPNADLAALLIEQDLTTESTTAEQLAAAAGGSLSKASEFADEQLRDAQQRLTTQLTSPNMDVPRLSSDLMDVITSAGKDAEARRQRFRTLLSSAIGKFSHQLRTPGQDSGYDPGVTLAALDRCLEAEEQLSRNANQSTLLESWLDDLAELQQRPT